MDYIAKTLLDIFNGNGLSEIGKLSHQEWKEVYHLAAKQGV